LARQPDLIKVWFIHRPSDDIAAQARLVQAVSAEAHAAGVRVIVHATELEVARAAAHAGADVLAHSVDDARIDDEFVRLLKERNVTYITTLMVQEGYRQVLGQDVRLTDIERRLGDPAVIATFDDLARLHPGAGWRMPAAGPRERIMEWNLRRLHEAGVTIAAGTDAGNIGTLHGPALHREMEMMAQAGLSPEAVLIAATRGAAQAMGRSADLGTIETGKRADLLLLDADPLADITHTRQIHRVIKDGEVLDPARLRAAMAAPLS
jgi:imidazolonepropionase-like amidohydrolase